MSYNQSPPAYQAQHGTPMVNPTYAVYGTPVATGGVAANPAAGYYAPPAYGQVSPPPYVSQPPTSPPPYAAVDMYGVNVGATKANGHGEPYSPSIPQVSQFVHEAELSVRLGFIRKVFTIVGVQLLFTFGVVALFTFHEGIRNYVQNSVGLMIGSIIVTFAVLIAFMCCPSVTQKTPTNYIFLAIFTICESFMVGLIASYYDTISVVSAVGITVLVSTGLILYAMRTKKDFTGAGPYLFVAVLCLMGFGILCAITRSEILQNVYAGIGALLFSFYLVYDVQLVCGGKHKHQFSIDAYIFAAINIYLDIINIFLFLLRLFGNRRD